MLAENRHGPKVARCARGSGIPHSAPRAARGIDEELGTRAESSPSRRCGGHPGFLTGPEFSCEMNKALSAADRHKERNPF